MVARKCQESDCFSMLLFGLGLVIEYWLQNS